MMTMMIYSDNDDDDRNRHLGPTQLGDRDIIDVLRGGSRFAYLGSPLVRFREKGC